MLKKLLLASILGLSFTASHAMQSPLSPITYEGPQPTLDNKEIKINARDEDNFAVGWIMYKYLANQKAEITLFSKCLAHICSKNPLRIHWFVTRIKDDSPSIATLVEIYKRMIGKLNLDKKLVTEDYETFTFMALEFNKQSMT